MKKIFFIKKKINYNKDIFKKYKFLFYFLIIFIILIFFFILFIKKNSENNIIDNQINNKNEEFDKNVCSVDCSTRLIDGELVDNDKRNPFIISAIIDNHSDARPQFGLSSARVVYDIPAEGGINRYLAFFLSDSENISKIGPVRSARPYFLEIAKEYQSLLLHCGGSPDALARIIKDKMLTLNEFYNGQYFSRYSNYQAPHNVLGDYKKIKEYLEKNNLIDSNFNSWKFKIKNSNFNGNEELIDYTVKVKNGQFQYDVEWIYNLEKNIYYKKIAGDDHKDNSGEIISADNLILQFVKTEILDKALRLKIELIGRGKAAICIDGYCRDGYWQKFDNNSRTIYYYDDDSEVIFNSGKTWIHFVDERTSVDISKITI